MLQGQPEANLPTEAVTQPNLESRSYAGAMGLPDRVSSLVRAQLGGDETEAQMAAPAAQNPTPETNSLARRVAPVTIPGIEQYGVPPITVRPRSFEDLVRSKVYEKMLEPFNLRANESRFVGGQEVARGPGAPPTRASIALQAHGGDVAAANADLGRRPPVAAKPGSIEDIVARYAKARGKNVEDLTDAEVAEARGLARRPPSQATDPDRADRLKYDEFVKSYKARHRAPTQTEITNAKTLGQTLDIPLPWPDFEKWRVMTQAERAKVLQNPSDRINDAEMLRRQTLRGGPTAARGVAPEAPAGWKYIPKSGGGWTAVPDDTR